MNEISKMEQEIQRIGGMVRGHIPAILEQRKKMDTIEQRITEIEKCIQTILQKIDDLAKG